MSKLHECPDRGKSQASLEVGPFYANNLWCLEIKYTNNQCPFRKPGSTQRAAPALTRLAVPFAPRLGQKSLNSLLGVFDKRPLLWRKAGPRVNGQRSPVVVRGPGLRRYFLWFPRMVELLLFKILKKIMFVCTVKTTKKQNVCGS